MDNRPNYKENLAAALEDGLNVLRKQKRRKGRFSQKSEQFILNLRKDRLRSQKRKKKAREPLTKEEEKILKKAMFLNGK